MMMHPKDTVAVEFRCNTDRKDRDNHHNHQYKTGPARNMARRLKFESLDELEAAIVQLQRGQRVVLPVHCNPCGKIAGATMELLDATVVPYDGDDADAEPDTERSALAARIAELEAENAALRENNNEPPPE